MAAPHDGNQSNHKVNGANGENGGDEFPPQQPQPSTSGTDAVRRPAPSLRTLFFRGMHLCRQLLYRLARSFSAQPLGQQTLDAVYCALTAAERTTVWANVAANEPQSPMWYIMMPLSLFLMIIRTGVQLAEKHLDIRVPQNQYLVNWLHSLRIRLKNLQESAAHVECTFVDRQPPGNYPYSHPALGPSLSPVSSESTMSLDEEPMSSSSTEEEATRPETPGDKSMYFSVEQLKEQEEEEAEATVGKGDTQQKQEEKTQKGKGEERTDIAAGEAEGAAMSTEEHLQPPAPPERSQTADEAERAAMSVAPLPSAQRSTSEDLLAAEGSSRAEPGTSESAQKARSKAAKGTHFLNLLGGKLG